MPRLRRKRLQLQLVLPYKFQPGSHHRVRAYLADGYVLEDVQRLSDREAVVTLALPDSGGSESPGSGSEN